MFGYLYNLVFPSKKDHEIPPTWVDILTPETIQIQYKWIKPGEVPEALIDLYSERGLMVFKTNPTFEFLDGYFTDFKVERDDGMFIQKIHFNNDQTEIQSAPLYFFSFESLDFKKIVDLHMYEFDSKGGADDFIISAYGKDSFEVRLTK